MRKILLFCLLSQAFAFSGVAMAATSSALPEVLFKFQQGTTALPSISSINPTSLPAGGPNFTLVVNGSNFVAPAGGANGTVVRINGQNRGTTFVSSTQLRAQLLATDVANVGTATISLLNPGGGVSTNTATLTITGDLYFAQIAEGKIPGGSFRTTIILVNPNNAAAQVTVDFFTTDGNPFPVTIGTTVGGGPSATFEFFIPPNSQLSISTSGTRPTLAAGWARVKSAVRIGGVALYQFFNSSGAFVTEAGVGSAPPATHFFVPVEFKDNFETALAFANCSEIATATVSMTLRDALGGTLTTQSITLAPRTQLARFIREIFVGFIPAGFSGSIEVQSTDVPVVATSVRTLGGFQTSSLPIVILPQ
ncbi:MAG TPA: IPT/TIG domain-containing protein [Acidobacteriota bacterium]|jgi:hypothetical protein